MTRVDWVGNGERFFEAGIDRSVLYIDSDPGVPWIGIVNVSQKQSGGQAQSRYLDGVKISNRASMEEFEGTIEAYTYPVEFEVCDGTGRLDNGLRATQQRRKSFGMTYRSKVGNDRDGIDHAYKLHILYNLRAEPSDRPYATLSDQVTPATFSWGISSRPPIVSGIRPTAHYVIDSRDTPTELLTALEDLLYGTEVADPTLPSAGELIFMFDSYQDLIYDAGSPYTPVFVTYDAGDLDDTYGETIDGGAL